MISKLHFVPMLIGSLAFAKVRIALNWKPEPQFGGFYAAIVESVAQKYAVDLEILPGGAGTPTVQMVAAGKVEFGVSSADEVIIARDRGMSIVALMAVYQTNPQGIMTRVERNFQKIQDVFSNPGKLAIQKGLAYSLFLEKKFGFNKLKVVPYSGGIAPFLSDPLFSQQCFITSEPLLVRKQGKNPKTFLIAEAGFNPYTTVVVARKDFVEKDPALVQKVIKVFREAWSAYLANPVSTNAYMHKLNPTMDIATFSESADAQKNLIEGGDAASKGIGAMTESRWEELARQLKELKLVKETMAGKDYFITPP